MCNQTCGAFLFTSDLPFRKYVVTGFTMKRVTFLPFMLGNSWSLVLCFDIRTLSEAWVTKQSWQFSNVRRTIILLKCTVHGSNFTVHSAGNAIKQIHVFVFCHEDTACIIQSPSEWLLLSVAQIKLHMNKVILEPEMRLRRTNHYKVKYLSSRETLRNLTHHVEKLYKAGRLLAFIYRRHPIAAVWLGIDYCVAVLLCNLPTELTEGPVQQSPTVTDPNIQTDRQNIKKAPMPGGGLNIMTQTTHSEMKT